MLVTDKVARFFVWRGQKGPTWRSGGAPAYMVTCKHDVFIIGKRVFDDYTPTGIYPSGMFAHVDELLSHGYLEVPTLEAAQRLACLPEMVAHSDVVGTLYMFPRQVVDAAIARYS